MKIIHVIDILNVGGAERVFVTICNLLSKNKISVNGLFLIEKGILKSQLNEDIDTFELKRTNKWSLKKMYECSKILKSYDLIHCHFKHVYVYIRLVSLIFNVETPILFHNHSSKKLNISSIFILKYIFKPRFLICVDNESMKFYKEQFNLQNENLFLLENIIIPSSNQSVNLPQKDFDIVLVGNIKQNKNNIFAVDLAEKLKKNILLIGKNQEEEYFKNLLNRINSSSVEIVLKQDVSDVSSYLNSCKIGISVSLRETGPLVLLEYLSNEIPFLAYETGEISKMLKPFFPEFFMDNLDINLWEERLLFLLNKKHDHNKMKEVFNQLFGEEEYLNKLLTIYKCVQKN
ncbi:MAG TPA: glycosyltransferase family 4 protein [Flavobacterium sp.]|uniref:glycosyltransferase family 4 protein n=1 Tax=unclassified Flavobacterium TaxID=196869 RepID=UPI0025BE6F6F|nr:MULTISPECIES: glycosyltransferase family 4 protein [unclassified Flavobacterium]HRE79338.1 glycosyltransferase family 4 protein [Flavobacterium sp.]